MITDDLIKELFLDKYKSNQSNFWHYISNEYKEYIINRYKDSDNKSESLYSIIHNIDIVPICKYCNTRKLVFKSFNKGYLDHCKDKHCVVLAIKNHTYQNNLIKYGVLHTSQLESVKNKMKQTCLDKYGVEYVSQSKQIQSKISNNNFHKYGVLSTSQLDDVKNKMKQTCLIRYGTVCSVNGDTQQQKSKQTSLIKYGTEYPTQSNIVKEKIDNSLRKHKTFRTSKDEELSYIELLKYFDEDDIIRQYKDDRYKNENNRRWNCDFYIKSLDLFIECNYSDFHHFKPFDKTDENDLKELNRLKEKSKKVHIQRNCKKCRYDTEIYVWTKLDVNKRNVAHKNNLNYLEFYTLKDFKNYFLNYNTKNLN